MPGNSSTTWSYSASASTVIVSALGRAWDWFASFNVTEWGIVVGMLTALGTFALNAHFQRKRDRREEEIRQLDMELKQLEIERQKGKCHVG